MAWFYTREETESEVILKDSDLVVNWAWIILALSVLGGIATILWNIYTEEWLWPAIAWGSIGVALVMSLIALVDAFPMLRELQKAQRENGVLISHRGFLSKRTRVIRKSPDRKIESS